MGVADEKEFTAHIVDLMQCIGPVRARRMFGGYGIFLDGLMFALIADGTLYLKAGPESRGRFLASGLESFTYSKKGKQISLSYYQAPLETLEDAENMKDWADLAFACALNAAAEKQK